MKRSHGEAWRPAPEPPALERRPVSDLDDVELRRERFFAQDRRILEAVGKLATTVRACPADPGYPEQTPVALVVGGFARDSLVGKHPKDADMEVYGVSAARLEELLDQLYGDRVNKVGRAFGVFKVALGDGLDLDISIPRRESKTGPGHSDVDVTGDPSMTILEAARRRDFTFNSLAVDPLTGEYADPFRGVEDLKSRALRVTDVERFQDDPLRVYRAVQFVARLDLQVEPRSLQLMEEMVVRGDMKALKAERITEEWKKLLLKAVRPSIGLELAKQLGIVERSHARLQGASSWERLKWVVDQAASVIHQPGRVLTEDEQAQIMVSALALPTEAPDKTLKEFFAGTSFSKKDVDIPSNNLIKEYLEPTRIWRAAEKGELTEKQIKNEIRKVVKRIHPASPEALMALNEAMEGETVELVSEEDTTYPPARLFRTHLLEHPEWLDPRSNALLRGEDLQARGIPPGPKMGKVLKQVEELRDRGGLETREEALHWLAEHKG